MARKAEKYVVGILFPYEDRTEIKYVTSVLHISKTAKWEDGKDAMTFSKDYAKDLAIGIIWNGNPAIVMLKEDWLNLRNPDAKEDNEELTEDKGE